MPDSPLVKLHPPPPALTALWVPFKVTLVLPALGSLLVTTKLPLSLTLVALVHPTVKAQLAPGARLKGAAAQPLEGAGAAVKPPLAMAAWLTCSTAVPVF